MKLARRLPIFWKMARAKNVIEGSKLTSRRQDDMDWNRQRSLYWLVDIPSQPMVPA